MWCPFSTWHLVVDGCRPLPLTLPPNCLVGQGGSSALDRNTAVNLCIRGRLIAKLRGIESWVPPTPFKCRARVAHGMPPCGAPHSCLDVRGLISVYSLTMLPEET